MVGLSDEAGSLLSSPRGRVGLRAASIGPVVQPSGLRLPSPGESFGLAVGFGRVGRFHRATALDAQESRKSGSAGEAARKWQARFEAEGAAGLIDRSSRPHRLHRPTNPERVAEIVMLRRQRLCGKHIAKQVGVSPATVSRVLRAARLGRMKDLDPIEQARKSRRTHPYGHQEARPHRRRRPPNHRRPQRPEQSSGARPGPRLGVRPCRHRRCLAHRSRMKKPSAPSPVLKAAVAYYRGLGVTVARVMTDNGSCYKSFDFRDACRELGLRHIRTRPALSFAWNTHNDGFRVAMRDAVPGQRPTALRDALRTSSERHATRCRAWSRRASNRTFLRAEP
jgi:hypothetical protein